MFLQGNTNQEKARIAISNRLFVNNWSLHDDLINIRDGNYEYDIELYYDHHKPIGIIVYSRRSIIGIFVRKKYRRQGIGTKLVNFVKSKYSTIEEASWGIYGSETFWQSQDIEIDTW